MTPPSIYRYFPDRAALLRAIIDRGFRQFDTFLEDAARGTSDPLARLERLCHAYAQFADTSAGMIVLSMNSRF